MYPGKSNLDYRTIHYRPLGLILFHGVRLRHTPGPAIRLFPTIGGGRVRPALSQISILMSLAARVGTTRQQGSNFNLLLAPDGGGS